MTDNNSTNGRRILASLVAVLMVTSVLGPIGVASAQTQAVSFTQTVQSGDATVAPGETFTVEASVTAADDLNGPAIDVDLPSGWTVTSQSPDGGTYKPSEVQWVWLSGSHTITYTVQVPSDASAGDYTVAGEGSGIDSSEDTRVTDADDLTVSVEEPNQAPTADAGGDQTVEEGASVQLDASGSSDADGSIASYSWTQTNGPSVSLSDAAAAQPTFTAPDVDSEQTLTFELEVTDDDGATATDTVSVTVQPAQDQNQPPSVGSITDQTVTEGDSATVPVSTSDPDGDSVSLSVSGPDFVSLSNGDLSITPQTGDAANSPYTVEVTATDGNGGTATESFELTVQAENQAPTADAGSDQTVDEGASVQLDASGSSDPDGDALSYSWTQTTGPSVSLSDAAAAQPTFTAPDVDSEQTLTFEVEVSDGTATATDTVDVTVQPVTTNPSVSITQTVTSSTPVTPGGSVTIEATIDYSDVNSPAIDVDLPSGWTVTSQQADGGAYKPSEVQWVWAEGDTDGVSNSHTVTYTVEVPGDAADGDYTVSAEGSAIDPADDSGVADTDGVTVPVEAETAGATSAEVAITQNSGVEASTYGGGSYQVTNTGDTNIQTLTVDLSETMLPDMVFDPFNTAGDDVGKEFTLDSGDVTVENVEYTNFHNGVDNDAGYDTMVVTLSGFEPGETMSFSVDNDPTVIDTTDLGSQAAGPVSGLEITGGTVAIDSGSGPVEATIVGDGSAGGSTATVQEDTSESAPSIGVQGVSLSGTTLSDRHSAATVPSASQTITITGAPANAEVTLLRVDGSLDLSNVPTPYELEEYEANKAVQVEYITTTTDSNGEATVDVTLTDAGTVEESGLNYFTAWVNEPDGDTGPVSDYVILQLNAPPTADAGADQTVDEGTTVTLDAAGSSDADGSITSYSWTQTGGAPSVTLSDASAAQPTFTAPDVSSDTTLTFALDVTDDDGSTATETVSVTVQTTDDGPGAVGDLQNAPTDPDGDGEYEDVNGDGSVNVGDAQALFANLGDPVVQTNVDAFDFNDDGSVNVGDAQALFAAGIEVSIP